MTTQVDAGPGDTPSLKGSRHPKPFTRTDIEHGERLRRSRGARLQPVPRHGERLKVDDPAWLGHLLPDRGSRGLIIGNSSASAAASIYLSGSDS